MRVNSQLMVEKAFSLVKISPKQESRKKKAKYSNQRDNFCLVSCDPVHPPGSDRELQGRAGLARVPVRSLVDEGAEFLRRE